MQVIAFSSSRPGPEGELQRFDRLTATLSSQFARLHAEEIGTATLLLGMMAGLAAKLRLKPPRKACAPLTV